MHNALDCRRHASNYEPESDDAIENEEEEELVVEETYAVVKPWAMVIHLQDAAFAHPTMVTAIGFVFPAPLAMSTVARSLGLLQRESHVFSWSCSAILG
jgi:hypothetical protein